ncbi:hypothetical protein LCGC14_2944070, partial [marine sediment metagenome]
PKLPGSVTWVYKPLIGATAYALTPTQRTNALGKYANIYTTTAGIDGTEEGRVASGEFIDVIRGTDQLRAWLQEYVFTALAEAEKIPFTNDGIGILVAQMEAVFNRSVSQGILVKNSTVITIPLASSVSTSDKANRIAPNIPFTTLLAGAIHTVPLIGVVSV